MRSCPGRFERYYGAMIVSTVADVEDRGRRE
jgi:hypothetical protein